MSTRDDFKEPVKRKLAERAGYKCSNPFCRVTTIGAQQGGDGSVSIGEAAHICAASPGGKRYNPNMTSEERGGYDNGIWLCRTHAAMIDRDEKYFTIKMLEEWKKGAEEESSNELIGVKNTINRCKVQMKLFYKDLEECRKNIEFMKKARGVILDPTNFPIQDDWENRAIDMVSLIGADIASELIRILREIEEMKNVMERETKRTKGKPFRDMEAVRYCNRADLFKQRMTEWLTDDFMEALTVFSEL